MVKKEKAQEWLDKKYGDKKVIEIKIDRGVELEGSLKIDNYPDLKAINLSGSKELTKIVIENCLGIEEIDVYDNKITSLEGISKLVKLKKLVIQSNKLKELDISENKNLGFFNCRDNIGLKIVGIENVLNLYHYNGGWKDGITLPFAKIREKELIAIVKEFDVKSEDLRGKSSDEISDIIGQKAQKMKELTIDLEKLRVKFTDLQKKSQMLEDNIKKELGVDALEEFEEKFIAQTEVSTPPK